MGTFPSALEDKNRIKLLGYHNLDTNHLLIGIHLKYM